MAVVAVINAGRAKDKTLMHLLRCMFFVAAHLDIQIHANHVPGVENVAADALSRNCMSTFLQEVPAADPQPTAIPQALVDMTVMEQPDWTSPRWAQLFSAFCGSSPGNPEGVSGREEEISSLLPGDVHPTLAGDRAQTSELCSIHSKPGFEAPGHQMLPVRNSSPPDRVRRGRPKSGEYATSGPSLAWDEAGAGGSGEAHPTATHTVILEQLRRVWNQDPNQDHVMLWAMCCVGFFGFLRSGEMTAPEVGEFDAGQHLSVADITVDDMENPQSVDQADQDGPI